MKKDLEIAEEALAKWPTETMGILRTGIRNDLLLPAIADARAAGFAEAIEMAAKAAEDDGACCDSCCDSRIAAAIRALAPAKEEEP